MIKKLILLFFLLCGASLALPPGGTTVQVTARLADPGNVIVASRTFVRAELKNTGGQQCRVGGTEVITPYLKDFTPDASGNVTAILQKNSAITCGSSTGNTQWAFTIWRDGKPQPTCFLQVNTGIALESAVCLNSAPTPTTTLPTDSVYARVDGSNAGFTGAITDTVSIGAPLFICTEGTAPSGLAGFDLLYCDSSLHRPRWINNNGTVTSDALLSDNLGSFASTTSAQLASVISDESGSGPLLFANANTQDSPTITTKATITETTAPSGVAGKDVIYADSTAHRLKVLNNNGSAVTFAYTDLAQTWSGSQSGMALASPTITGIASGNGTIPTAMLATTPGLLSFSCTGAATANTTLVLTGATCTATTGFVVPVNAGTVKNLFCRSIVAGVNASSGLITVRKNISNQTLTCTIGTTTACNDQTHTFAVAAGDAVDIIFTTQIGETLAAVACSMEKI